MYSACDFLLYMTGGIEYKIKKANDGLSRYLIPCEIFPLGGIEKT